MQQIGHSVKALTQGMQLSAEAMVKLKAEWESHFHGFAVRDTYQLVDSKAYRVHHVEDELSYSFEEDGGFLVPHEFAEDSRLGRRRVRRVANVMRYAIMPRVGPPAMPRLSRMGTGRMM